ncbi:MAG: GNAT family N-acetyltransferase [Treponema sp.]|jgi:predicted N-acyltransferase|nr:GNAT family N-acetyltransferase [Treponema sp.]
MAAAGYELKILRSIDRIKREQWNALTGENDLPFLEWEWLSAMETSGSIGPETGWHPLHFTLWSGERLLAAAPFYLKTNSGGEYVYDYFWAEAAHSLRHHWYPKLVGTVPATPAEGYHFLHSPEISGETVTALILDAAEKMCRRNNIVSLSLLFADPGLSRILPSLGYTAWEHSHYLWQNHDFKNFDAYLDLFTKGQRKNIRKEYRSPPEQGVVVGIVEGEKAGEEHFRKMFELFSITNDKFYPWDARWVNEEFFMYLEKEYRRRLVFVEARRDDEILALAFLVRKNDRIWGRYWGAYEEIRNLHFAACYYAPMDWCIREGIHFFDPGAGSAHKIRRGFRLCPNRSWHKFFDPLLEQLFINNINAINLREEENIALLNAELPFK